MGSTFFQIWVFLAFGALCLIALVFIAARNRDAGLKINRWWYFSAFILLGGLGMFTARNYVFPSKAIFDNSKYHILEHDGFQFEKKLALVQSRYSDESLWDSKTGIVTLERDTNKVKIEIEKYYEPFYLSASTDSKYFKLENNIINSDVSKGFILKNDNATVFQLKVIPQRNSKKDSCLYLSRTNANAKFDTSTFTLPINRGYPLLDILFRTPHLQISDELRFMLDESLLVRDSIEIDNRAFASEVDDNNESPLRFFPKSNFYLSPNISFGDNTQFNPDTSFHFLASQNSLFYSGTGYSKTDIFRIEFVDTNEIRLNFILPKMQPLRDTSGQMFITSSIDEVKNQSLKAGYLFNIFESSNNKYNFNATLRYNIGSPTEAMFFKIKDLYSNKQEKEIFRSDTVIVLKSQLAEDSHSNNFRWLFKFRNLRETNSFQLKHINWFILIFIFLIGLRFFFDTRRITAPFRFKESIQSIDHIGKITAIELSIYVVVFCFSIVRLILVWRMSTFVPIEDIDPGRFYKLRDGYSVFLWTVLLVAGCILLLSFVKILRNSPDFRRWLFTKLWLLNNKYYLIFISLTSILLYLIANLKFHLPELFSLGIALVVLIIQCFLKRSILKVISLIQNIWSFVFRPFKKVWDSLRSLIYQIPFAKTLIKWCHKHLISTPSRSKILLYFILTVSVLFGFSKLLPESFARLLNIPIPVLSYFIFDFLLLRAEERTGIQSITPKYFQEIYRYIYFHYSRITLWLIAFAYLAIQDSGFSIIFLLFGVIHHIFSIFFFKYTEFKKSKWLPWLYILFITVAFYFFLHWQSKILLSVFSDTFIWMIAISGALCSIAFFIGTNPYLTKGRLGVAAFLIVVAMTLTIGSNKFSHWLNENKSYVKYRAEIQLPNKGVEDLIKENKFQSTDITYILRSAHNQWFINLYNNNPPENYFTIQPHFNQGSSYTTQTTDLVVTRYLVAEHPKAVIIFLMLLLFLLPLVYSFELNLKEPKINFSILGVFILLFSIALFVCLSATNRVVFFGQDFPFLSLTSRIAIAFPILIFLIAIFNSWNQREPNNDTNEDVSNRNKVLFPVAILIITLTCIFFLNPKNKEKDESHFNISQLIEKTAIKVHVINDEFNDYQYSNRSHFKRVGIDSLISNYVRDESQSEKLHLALTDTTDKFLSSLLSHFISPLTNKWDPNELIHIRKRGTYYNITVNRKYYFISSFKEEKNKWEGDLLAAKAETKFGFLNKSKHLFIPVSKNDEAIPNILDLPGGKSIPELRRYRDSLNNIFIMKIDPSWTANSDPLYLIKSDEGDFVQNKANFHIYNDTVTINGNYKYPAIRLIPGDLLVMDIKQERNSRAVVKWNVVEENEKYLAKNLWLNGKQNLFYPLGKELMWSYSFANLVSQTWSDSSNMKYRKSNLRVSVDYDLTQKLFDIIDVENKSKLDISDAIREKLIAFRDMDLASKKNPNNASEIFLINNKLFINENSKYRNNPKLKEAIDFISKKFHSVNPDSYNNDLVKLINETTEKKFDYSTVVLDGYGRIRAIFDYSRYSKTDPNNIKDFNRFLSELYKQSSVATEKDYFGNKSLMTINPGPGSSFKPIAFTAVSSKINFGWENLKVEPVNPNSIIRPIPNSRKNKTAVAFYGGKSLLFPESYWNLDNHNFYDAGLNCNRYLVTSNNLFHSVVIFLGSQSESTLKSISNNHQYDILFKDISNNPRRDSSTFPVINFQNHSLSLDPSKWLQKPDFFGKSNSVLASGLEENFHLSETSLSKSDTNYFNSFGKDSLFNMFFVKGNTSSFIWSYPEQSTFNQIDRTVSPRIRNGLIQPSLGSFPLKVTPLNMATMGMRLATLNRSKFITTLSPDSSSRQQYKFFNLDNKNWDTTGFLKFYKQNVLLQLFDVVNGGGTAAGLKSKLSKYTAQGYFFYAKTGTINIEDDSDERGKHLLVIITNKKIDDIANNLTTEELKNLRYYVIYMSYHGIDKDEFDIGNFGKIISAVMDSELFTKYMNEGK